MPALFVLCIPGTLGMFGTACAEVRWNGSLALTSDYIQQGLSQTQGTAALQGGLNAQVDDRWSLGAWASNVDRYESSSANLEIDLYAARAWKISPEWIASLTATHYFYPDDAPAVRYDYDELTASLGYRSTLFATVAWSPNYADASYRGVAEDRSSVAYELSANRSLRGSWSGNAGVGYRDLSELFDEQYWYGHVGLMLAARRLTLHLTYTYVEPTARRLFGHERASNTWSGTLIWRFGQIE